MFRECHNIALKQTHEPEVPNVLNRGASAFALAYLNFLITVVSVSKLRLMWLPSFNLVPSAFVWEARSLPARSTRFCRVQNSNQYNLTILYHQEAKRGGSRYHTKLARKDFTRPELSRRLLFMVWNQKSENSSLMHEYVTKKRIHH